MTFFKFLPPKITPPILDADWPFWMFNSIGIIYVILALGATHYPNFQTYTSKETIANGSSFFRTLRGSATQS